jgi:hypothetical protein
MIKNVPEDRGQHCNDIRGAFEHRATWLYYLVEEAKKRGLDCKFAHDAIHDCGQFHGDHKYTKTDDLKNVFAPEFANKTVIDAFQMDILRNDGEHLDINFHYCPLVAAWLKLGAKEEDLPELCEIAMDGDRGIISTFPKFEFKLGDTIAKGNDVCEIRISKVEKK